MDEKYYTIIPLIIEDGPNCCRSVRFLWIPTLVVKTMASYMY